MSGGPKNPLYKAVYIRFRQMGPHECLIQYYKRQTLLEDIRSLNINSSGEEDISDGLGESYETDSSYISQNTFCSTNTSLMCTESSDDDGNSSLESNTTSNPGPTIDDWNMSIFGNTNGVS